MLKVGDFIVCNISNVDNLTYGKKYEIISVRHIPEEDICILGDDVLNWWFGQVGSTDPWTMYFVDETVWNREQKINSIT